MINMLPLISHIMRDYTDIINHNTFFVFYFSDSVYVPSSAILLHVSSSNSIQRTCIPQCMNPQNSTVVFHGADTDSNIIPMSEVDQKHAKNSAVQLYSSLPIFSMTFLCTIL